MTTRYDILPPVQRSLLPALQPLEKLGFALYGGTAIALHLGHRESIDFDFFTSHDMDEEWLLKHLPFLADAVTLQREPQTWTVQAVTREADRPVKLSFFGGLDFGRVGQPVMTDGGELQLASRIDLFGHKLKVILQRVEAKDYRDIAALLRSGLSIERGLSAARALFGPVFAPAEAMRALTYFKGGDLDRLDASDRKLLQTIASQVGPIAEMPIVSKDLTILRL